MELKQIAEKKRRLEEIKVQLKEEFFGIDATIDKIVDSVKTWYLIPEIINRPVIVNLWGLTGVGKTALVRSLVKKLEYASKFVEIQMDGHAKFDNFEKSSICSVLQSSSIDEGTPCVILLDEFQRFRTVDSDGEDEHLEAFNDVWMLLSDGKFSSDYSLLAKIEQQLAYMDYQIDSGKPTAEEFRRKKGKKPKARKSSAPKGTIPPKHRKTARSEAMARAEAVYQKTKVASEDNAAEKTELVSEEIRKFVMDPWEAGRLKKMLRAPQSQQEIMTWDSAKVRKTIQAFLAEDKNTAIDYSKSLIFVCGNLDEAFNMAGDIENCDTDADIFHAHSLKISIVEIKKALKSRFKPEQIARLGNNHIIYPSLNKDAYYKLIRRVCAQYTSDSKSRCGVEFAVDPLVYDRIYENAVYPTQGTRPVFTSIHKMFGSPISDGILWAMENKVDHANITVDMVKSCITFTGNSKSQDVKIDFDIRDRKAKESINFKAMVSVHEGGHALAYAVLSHQPPSEIAINLASFKGGYVITENEYSNKKELMESVQISLAGTVAEEVIFGEQYRSAGCGSDLINATRAVSNYVRKFGMSEFAGIVMTDGESICIQNTDRSDDVMMALLQKARADIRELLLKNKPVLLTIAKEILAKSKITGVQFYDMFKDQIEGLTPLVDVDTATPYHEMLLKQ